MRGQCDAGIMVAVFCCCDGCWCEKTAHSTTETHHKTKSKTYKKHSKSNRLRFFSCTHQFLAHHSRNNHTTSITHVQGVCTRALLSPPSRGSPPQSGIDRRTELVANVASCRSLRVCTPCSPREPSTHTPHTHTPSSMHKRARSALVVSRSHSHTHSLTRPAPSYTHTRAVTPFAAEKALPFVTPLHKHAVPTPWDS
jgi:hypothetical protein